MQEDSMKGLRHTVVRDRGRHLVLDFDSENLLTANGKLSLVAQGLTGAKQIPFWFGGLIVEDRHVTDAVTNGTTTLTSATAGFSPDDVGRQLTVYLAGPGGLSLVTTIAAYVSPATVTMASAANDSAPLHVASIGPRLTATDSYQAHPGWREIGASLITNPVRPTWKNPRASLLGTTAVVPATGFAPPSYEMANAIPVQYVHGFFLASVNVIGDSGSGGVLFAEGEYSVGALALGPLMTVTDAYSFTLS
jgi:hypothetical protein